MRALSDHGGGERGGRVKLSRQELLKLGPWGIIVGIGRYSGKRVQWEVVLCGLVRTPGIAAPRLFRVG